MSLTLPAASDQDVFSLGERCADAYRKADVLHHEAMELLVAFDAKQGYEEAGFGSVAEWLAWRIGIKPNAARERVRTALALASLPLTSAALREGAVSFTKARAITRVATPESEAALLEFAQAGSANNLERVVRAWKKLDGKAEITAEQARFRTRHLSAFVDDDGMVVVRGRLDPEAGAMLMRAIEAGHDALYRRGQQERGQQDNGQQDSGAQAAPGGRTRTFGRTGPKRRVRPSGQSHQRVEGRAHASDAVC